MRARKTVAAGCGCDGARSPAAYVTTENADGVGREQQGRHEGQAGRVRPQVPVRLPRSRRS